MVAVRGLLLKINLLGEFQVLIDDEPASKLNTLKSRALLAYLAMEAGRPLRRAYLAELLWPELPSGVARTNLRQALKILKQAIDPGASPSIIRSSRQSIEIPMHDDLTLDVDQFRTQVDSVRRHAHDSLGSCAVCARKLEEAVDCYRGDFLEDLYVPDSREFEEWAAVQRESLRQDMLFVLDGLIEIRMVHNDLEDAILAARKLVAFDPWDERKQRQLMHLLAAAGNRSEALRQFETCRKILRDEFDVEPSEATIKLAEEIKRGAVKEIAATFDAEEIVKPRAERSWGAIGRLSAVVAVGMIAVFLLLQLQGKEPAIEPDNPIQIQAADRHESERVVEPISLSTPETTDEPLSDPDFPHFKPFDPEDERAVLMDFFHDLEGESWTHADGWGTEAWHCEWYGITCLNGSVNMIEMDWNNLQGEIPTYLGRLRNLEILILSNNRLRGSIPPEIREVQNLGHLALAGNAFLGGEIPPEIGELKHLVRLSLSALDAGTQIEGSIPPELGGLVRLSNLEIADARLTGEIPEALGNLSHLEGLELSCNPLSGTIPASFGQLVNLKWLLLGGCTNDLAGPVPMELINLQKLEAFDFSQTNFCEPQDPAFQAWLAGIGNLHRTGIPCP